MMSEVDDNDNIDGGADGDTINGLDNADADDDDVAKKQKLHEDCMIKSNFRQINGVALGKEIAAKRRSASKCLGLSQAPPSV